MAAPAPPPPPRPRFAARGMEPARARWLIVTLWAIGAGLFAWLADFAVMDALTLAALGIALVLPVVVVTLALMIAAATWSMRQETRALQGTLDELRRDMLQRDTGTPPAPAPPPDADTIPPLFLSQRSRRSALAPLPDQPSLALGPESRPEPAPVSPETLIRALNFPEDEHDSEGFDALRAALTQPRLAPLIRAAQDVLTRLAQEGIYMDDLRPERARAAFWRAFAQGARGPQIAPLGGIRDRSCLAITAGRMRADPEFRASAHLFLREFDQALSQVEPEADDTQIAALADTRSARAFMLIGRVSGVFSR